VALRNTQFNSSKISVRCAFEAEILWDKEIDRFTILHRSISHSDFRDPENFQQNQSSVFESLFARNSVQLYNSFRNK